MLSHAASTQNEESIDRRKLGRLLLDSWRRDLTEIDIRLKYPKVIDQLLSDSASGEPVNGDGAVKRFCGQIIYFTDKTVTVRRPCGTILVLANDEILQLSDGRDRVEL